MMVWGGYVDVLTNGECNQIETNIRVPLDKLVLHGEPANVDRVWLLSIRHSGTHYMYKYLQALGYERAIVFWETMTQKHPTGSKQFIHAHLEVGHEYQRSMTDEKCVMPLRNPIEVFKSHCYRYRWEEHLYVPYVLNAFKRFDFVLNNYNAHIFCVDASDQYGEVTKLGEFFDSYSWTYKEQDKNIATTRTRPVSLHQGFTEAQVKLFNDPPDEIFKLAEQYGY